MSSDSLLLEPGVLIDGESAPVNQMRALADTARNQRERLARQGATRGALLSVAVVLSWLSYISLSGQWGRVGDNVAAAITMVFGSFVAGSTPQGGGAVAFPVFTKVLGVTAEDARTFSLSIQALGMGTAAGAIAFTRRAVDTSALRRTIPAAIVGYVGATLLLTVFTPPSAYTKVFFTLIVAAAGISTVLSRRTRIVEQLAAAPLDRAAIRHAVSAVAAAGGAASALIGSGADVAVYLLLTVVLGVRPAIGVATSVVTMAAVSIVGLAYSLMSGALDPAVIVEGTDVFGMWLAAIPVVVVGAPVGSWLASRVSTSSLTWFIAVLSALELVSTAVFLEDLRTNAGVLAFAIFGVVVVALGVRKLLKIRTDLAIERQPQCATVRRLDLEVGTS